MMVFGWCNVSLCSSLNYMDQLVSVERDAFQNLPEMVKLEVYSNPGLVSVDPHAFRCLSLYLSVSIAHVYLAPYLLPVYLYLYLSPYLLPVSLPVSLPSPCLPVSLPITLPSTCISTCLPTFYLSLYLSPYLLPVFLYLYLSRHRPCLCVCSAP